MRIGGMTSTLRAWVPGRLGQGQEFLPLGPVVLGARCGLLPDADDLVAGPLGEGAKIPLLAGTGVIFRRFHWKGDLRVLLKFSVESCVSEEDFSSC